MSSRDAIEAGEEAERAGDFIGAIAAYRTALEQAKADPALAGDAQFHLGRAAWRQGQLDAAEGHFELARREALRAGDDEARARAENGLGLVHYGRGEYVQAKAALTVARDLSRDGVMRAKALLNLGIIANIEGDFDTARSNYSRSRLAFDLAGDEAGEALALHNLGMLHADLREWDAADDAFQRCLVLCEAQGNRPMIASILVNRSEVHCGRGAYDQAVADCDRAMAIATEIGAEVQRGEALRWRGHALTASGHLAEGERAIRDALQIAKRTRVKLLEAESTLELGANAAARHEGAAARKWWLRAAELFDDLGLERQAYEAREQSNQLDGP